MEETKDKIVNLSNDFIKQYYDVLPTKELKLNKEFKLKMHVGHDLLDESKLPPERKRSSEGDQKKLIDTTRQYDKEYFQNYYTNNLKCKILCDRYDSYITKTNMSRHKKSPYCISYGLKEHENNQEVV